MAPMKIFALADPHLALGIPGKDMDRFGPQWIRHHATIEENWREVVSDDDLVLIAGDVSWGMRLADAGADLRFLERLPGQIVLSKGNHDYWWDSIKKVRHVLPDNMHAVQGDAIRVGDIVIGGTRLWDLPDGNFHELIDWQPNEEGLLPAPPTEEERVQARKIYDREVQRLDRALGAMNKLCAERPASLRIVMTHYPPCGHDLAPNELTERFEAQRIDHVVFGHLHAVKKELLPVLFGERSGVRYHLTSCDTIDFRPVPIAP